MLQLSSSSNRPRESVADFDELAAVVPADATEAFVKVNMSGPLEALRGGVVANEATASNRSACCVKYLHVPPNVIDGGDRRVLSSAEKYLLGTTSYTGDWTLTAKVHLARAATCSPQPPSYICLYSIRSFSAIPISGSHPWTTPNMLKKNKKRQKIN